MRHRKEGILLSLTNKHRRPPLLRRDIHGYEVLITYTRKFPWMLCDSMEACAMDVGSEFLISVNKAVEVDSSWSGLWWKNCWIFKTCGAGGSNLGSFRVLSSDESIVDFAHNYPWTKRDCSIRLVQSILRNWKSTTGEKNYMNFALNKRSFRNLGSWYRSCVLRVNCSTVRLLHLHT